MLAEHDLNSAEREQERQLSQVIARPLV